MAKVQFTETILRDAHQSQGATRMRLDEMLPMCEMLDPPLTTVHLCKSELGSHAVDQLHRRITAGQVPHRTPTLPVVSTTLSTRLVIRTSVKNR